MMASKTKIFILLISGFFVFANEAYSQLNVGADIVNRYVWRGTDFGNSPSIQPELSYTTGGLELGLWAAYATNGDPDGTEVDIWATYKFETDAGSFSLYATDYTFPIHHMGGDYVGSETWFDSDAHFIELGVGYSGTDGFPISVFAGLFVHNDEDNSVYIEFGYDADPVEFFLGFTPMESAVYGTTGAGIINMGLTGSRELRITETFSLGLFSTFVINPYIENMHLLFGISL
jgi:hypothetical protein